MITPIVTKYAGYRFRSRLEARWAVFMDALGVAYDYEREGYPLSNGYYLPDFWLPRQECWMEIKGATPTENEWRSCLFLAERTGYHTLLFAGNIGPDASAEIFFPGCGATDHDYRWCECLACGEIGIEFRGYINRLPCRCLERDAKQHGSATKRIITCFRRATEMDFTALTPRVEELFV